MNKQFFRNTMIAWAAFCMMSLPMFGQTEPPEDPVDIPKPVKIMLRYLDLEPGQVAEFGEVRQELRECVQPLREELQRLRESLKEALSQDPPSSELVGDLVIETYAVKAETRRCHQAYQEAFINMLSDEQARKMEILQAAARLRPVVHAFSALGLLRAPTDSPETDAVDDTGGV